MRIVRDSIEFTRGERERERATSTSTNYVPFDISYHLTWNVRFVISRADWWCARHYSRHPYVAFHYPININYYCRSLEDARGLGNDYRSLCYRGVINVFSTVDLDHLAPTISRRDYPLFRIHSCVFYGLNTRLPVFLSSYYPKHFLYYQFYSK